MAPSMSASQMASLAASIIGLISHAAQLLRSVRSRSTKGLSLATFSLLTLTFLLSIIMGIQYRIGAALVFTVTSTALTLGVLALISLRVTLGYLLAVALVTWGAVYGPLWFRDAVVSTRYAEEVAFAWGALSAIAFVPQVFKARRIRNTRDLSRISLLMSASANALWLTFAVLVRNYAMLFWLGVMSVSLLELVRLKLTEPSGQPLSADRRPASERSGAMGAKGS